jgi:recombination protein RecR
MKEIEKLISIFSKFPGFGIRSARRTVLYLLESKDNTILGLADLLKIIGSSSSLCRCGNIDVISPCGICSDKNRDTYQIAVVENVQDLWAIERSSVFRGLYCVLSSDSQKNSDSSEKIEKRAVEYIISKIKSSEIKEVIIATSITLEGQTKAFFINEALKNYECKISRLGSGVPVGGELDYLDEATISAAISSRKDFI